MRKQSAESTRFPATCARCGGLVSEPVSFCPHCGTHARLAFGREARRAAPSTNMVPEAPLADALLVSRPTPLFASANINPYEDMRPPMAESGRQWGIKGGTALTLLAFVVLYGGILLMHRHDDASTQTQQATLRTVEGSVQPGAPGAGGDRRDVDAGRAQPSAGVGAVTPAASAPSSVAQSTVTQSSAVPKTTAATAPSAPPPAPAAQAAKPATPAPSIASIAPAASDLTDLPPAPRERPGNASRTSVASVVAPSPAQPEGQPTIPAQRSVRETPARAPSTALPPAPGETRGERRQASAARSLATAQDSLSKNNLSAARRAIADAQAAQPDNSAAFMLQQDLHSRERARDAALSAARVCLVQQQWNCAWHNAGNALSLDSSSVEAKALVDRAIVESGAAARPPGPGPDGPPVPMLTQ